MQGDIHARRDQGRSLSYEELREVLGCTANAARMHAVRRKWPRRLPNQIGGCATVLVPEEVAAQPRVTNMAEQTSHTNDAQSAAVQANGRANQSDAHVAEFDTRATNSAIEALREQLAITNRRVDEEHARADRAEQRLDEERMRSADAHAAERITRDEAAGLREQSRFVTLVRLKSCRRPLIPLWLTYRGILRH